MKTTYEYIVLGCGGIGSAAVYWLSRRAGPEVLGVEQFRLGHSHGGSQDFSRIIRLSYHHRDYTRLTPHTYTAWSALEKESAVQVVTQTGGVLFAEADSPHRQYVDQFAAAMDAADIAYERFGADEMQKRFPQFRFDREVDVLYQAETGIANAIRGNAAHVATARYHGATILDRCGIRGFRPIEGGVEIDTERGAFSCRKLIIAAGAWTARVLDAVGLDLGLTVTQEQVTYYATANLRDFAVGRFPVFIWHGDDPIYGFPVYGEVATKAGIDAAGPAVTVDTRTYDPDPLRERRLDDWLGKYIPGFLGPRLYTKTCLYTMPRDRNFIIDALPAHPQVLICVGAGHAYKFAGLLGRILSELAIDGRTDYPIAPFTLNRAAITDPNFGHDFHI